MKNFTIVFAVFFISFASIAGNRSYNRLDRLYNQDRWKCLRVAQKYMKRLPDMPESYYFGSAVYREKQRTHGQLKTRYMMMSKALGYAIKFEDLNDLDMMSRVNWGAFVLLLQEDTYALIKTLDENELGNLGDNLSEKHDDLMYLHKDVHIEEGPVITIEESPIAANEGTEVEEEENNIAAQPGYFGLATGNEIAASFNQIQEQELLKLINAEREALFLEPLKLNSSLTRAARYHAADMAQQDYFLHESYDRVDGELVYVADASKRIGQFQSKNNVYQQSIAGGTLTPKNTLLGWIGQDEDYDKIFSEDNKSVGIGLAHDPNSTYGYYWVIVVAEKR